MIKKEFNSIELLSRDSSWTSNGNTYTAIRNGSDIFVIYDHGKHERLVFKAGHDFNIDDDGNFIIYDETSVTSLQV
ncbi:MAG: hypothetical protein IIC67_01015 [Thaumarchaeota archaeon]|nr:hypothetical protein [Nitrososphaerota archaeon]